MNNELTEISDEPLRVLVVDDNPDDVRLIRRALAQWSPDVKVRSTGSTAGCLRCLQREGADLVILDYGLPGEDGLTFVRRLSSVAALPPFVIVSGRGDERVAAEAIRAGAFQYLPKDELTPEELGHALLSAVAQFRSNEDNEQLDEQIMLVLAAAAEGKDPTTGGHLQRLGHYAVALGRALKLDAHQLGMLRYGALLHDIGKLAVRTAVLQKAGPLNYDEWEEIQQHVVVGERLCSCLACWPHVRPIIRHHHERWDGTGYVDGLAGESIPMLARIVSVADAFDAMSSDRPYRRALAPDRVLQELRQGAGTQWDPMITEVFIRLVETQGLDPVMATRHRVRRAA